MQMEKRYMKRCSTSPVNREMQIKITVKYHLTPVRMAIIKKQKITSIGRMWRRGKARALLVRI